MDSPPAWLHEVVARLCAEEPPWRVSLSLEGNALIQGKGAPLVLLGGVSTTLTVMASYSIVGGPPTRQQEQRILKRWVDRGSRAVPEAKHKRDQLLRGFLLEQLHDLLVIQRDGVLFCSSCQAVLLPERVARRHFAGVYCIDCWERYKAANSKTCRLCRKPYWNCVC